MSQFEISFFEKCLPPFWAKGSHAQTLAGHFLFRVKKPVVGTWNRIVLDDGDVLAVQEVTPLNSKKLVSVILFHGLSGDSDSDYMQRSAKLLLEEGYTLYLGNHRGCGEGASLARNLYHSGRGEDLSVVVDWVRQKNPSHKVVVIGFSLSGNALLNLVTGRRGSSLPDAAISINAPIHLASCADLLAKSFNKVYQERFLRRLSLQLRMRSKLGALSDKIPINHRYKNMRAFDDLVTAPASGFRNADHYYEECSTFKYLHLTKVPTLLLTSEDDPFVAVDFYKNAKPSSLVQLHIEKVGGHMGYVARGNQKFSFKPWLDYFILNAVKSILG